MRPLADVRGTTYVGAFLIQGVISAVTVALALHIDARLKEHGVSTPKRGMYALGVTMVTTFVILMLAHVLFGYGAAMVDNTTPEERLKMQAFTATGA